MRQNEKRGWSAKSGALRNIAILSIITLVLAKAAILQAATPVQCFRWATNRGGATITGYTCSDADVTIPSTINGLPVTSIGNSAFYWCSGLASVSISSNVTSIGDWAFALCSGLTNVTIPTSVKVIGNSAFYGCYGLTSVAIPNSVAAIGNSAFYWCSGLTNITIPSSVADVGDSAFYSCSGLTSATIPSSVTHLGPYAFADCTGLTNVTIRGTATSVGACAFAWCSGLKEVTIPSSVTISCGVTNIGSYAFAWCGGLTAVYFRGNAATACSSVFEQSPRATVYYLPGTTGWGASYAGRPTAFWFLPNPVILVSAPSFGAQSNRFGFIISWATNATVIVEASPALGASVWSPISTNTVTMGSHPLTDGWLYFSDPTWTNRPARFYRVRSL
jgi:hypothetical protein